MTDQRIRGAALLAVVLGVGTVLVVLAATAVAGIGDPPGPVDPGRARAAATTPVPPAGDLPPLPGGDYRAVCAELRRQVPASSIGTETRQLADLYRRLDLAALIAVAPEGLRPALAALRDDREAVLALLDQVEDTAQIRPEELPDGFAAALVQLGRTTMERCG